LRLRGGPVIPSINRRTSQGIHLADSVGSHWLPRGLFPVQMGSKHMSRTILVVALSLLLGGCSAVSSRLGGGNPFPSDAGKLAVLNYSGTYLARPAYFAKFEIIDRVGASLLYPIDEEDRRQIEPGSHYLQGRLPTFVKSQRELYAPVPTGLLNAVPGAIGEVTILVVTSDQPLNLDTFLRAPEGLRDHLGEYYTSWDDALDEILRMVVRNPGSAVWEYDFRVVSVPATWAIGR